MELKKTLELPTDNLQERRNILEEELSMVVKKLAEVKITQDIIENIDKDLNKIPFTRLELEWDFHPESDDEGGVDYWPSDLTIESDVPSSMLEVFDIDDINELPIKYKYESKLNNNVIIYETNLRELIHETLCNYSSDLYEYSVYSITVVFEEGE